MYLPVFQGTTTYFSSNCDTQDAEVAQEFMNAKDLSGYNTRLFKTTDEKSNQIVYEVRLASVETGGSSTKIKGSEFSWCLLEIESNSAQQIE